ncbi:MAG: repeat protein, partial [Planctomycetaceae bacterium]|nr:repeat protein [Planctomycetaceae bacterium]
VNSVVNAGTFNEQGTGTTRFRGNNTGVAFSNSGTVNVQQGTLQLASGGTSSGNFNVDVAGTLFINSDYALTGTVAGGGSLSLSGVGSAAAPAVLEVTSQDAGNSAAAFNHNLTFTNLSLDNSFARLIDTVDNSPGAGAEALYVANLQVVGNSTFDLNNLHVYTRITQINGTILGGSLNVLPDGGPISLNLPTPGSIAVPGEQDNWTFFDRAGQAVTIQVNPGTAIQPATLPQTVDFAQVTLLDSSGNILATASNTSAGQLATLLAVAIPADGTYRVQVSAPGDHAGNQGNYELAVWNATVDTTSLPLNQQVYGGIDNPFNVDRWNFTSAANQEVQFHLIAAASSGVVFDLIGPDNTPLFSNLTSDSELLNLETAGAYTLVAHSIGGAIGAYSFQMQQLTQTPLTLNTSLTDTLVGTGDAHLYRIDVPASKALQVTLDDSTNSDHTELYLSFGTPPTRANYDYRFSSPSSADQSILVASSIPGTWYALVYGAYAPTSSSFSIKATVADAIVANSTPDRYATNNTVTMTLTGAGFTNISQIALIAADNTAFPATTKIVDSLTQITATFNLQNVPLGVYSVRITSLSGDVSTSPNSFTVTGAGQAHLETQLILPSLVGRHGTATFYVDYSNTGNVAMPAPILILQSADPDGSDKPLLTLDKSKLIENLWTSAIPEGFSNSIQIYASGATPGLLQPGESVSVPVYYSGLLRPWDYSDNAVEMEVRVHDAGSTETIDWPSLKQALQPSWIPADAWNGVFANLTAQIGTTWGDYVNMLSDNANYLGRLGQNITNASDLYSFELQQALGLNPVSVLAASTDASVPAPGLSLDFSRSFGNTITERYAIGPFGRGWTASTWDTSLEQSADGTVIVHNSANSERFFQPDSRFPGVYFSQIGDPGSLKKANDGTFTLTETNGTFTHFQADGTLDFIQDVNGNRITAGFAAGKLMNLTHSDGASLVFAYNSAGLIATLTSFASAADHVGRMTTYSYDPTNTFLLSASGPSGTTSYTYDNDGTDPASKYSLLSVTDPSNLTLHFEYDTSGRLTSTHVGDDLHRATYHYDSAGGVKVTDAAGVSNKVDFDYRGLIVRSEDGLGNFTLYTYNNLRQLIQQTDSLGHSIDFTRCDCGRPKTITDQLGATTKFTLGGPNNDPTAFTDALGNVTHYGYDAHGNLSSTTYADGSVEKITSDALGNPTTLVNRRGQSIDITYNAAGQKKTETFPDGSQNSYTYDPQGRMVTAVDAQGTTTFAYNNADEITRVDYPDNRSLSYQYDTAGRRIQMRDSTGFTVTYQYDAAGRLSELRDTTNSTNTLIDHYTYDPAGRMQREDKGNGTYTVYGYDGAGRLNSIVNHAPDNSINSQFDYTYDALGRPTTMATLDGTWTYSYDLTGQLTHAVFASTNPQRTNQDLSYTYDAQGNRVNTVINGVTANYTTNDLNQYTSVGATAYKYDADGNLIQEDGPNGTSRYTYDAANRLVQAVTPQGTWQYVYDALGNRTTTIHNGQRDDLLLDPTDPTNVVSEFDGSGNATAHYAYGIGLTSRFDATNSPAFYDFDALGSTAGLTNAAGSYVDKYSYLPFGESAGSTGALSNPFQFVGQSGVMQNGSGLDFMQARYYAPTMGRFTSQDPLRLAGGDANFYRYASNQPTDVIDPSGLAAKPAHQYVPPTMAGKVSKVIVDGLVGFGHAVEAAVGAVRNGLGKLASIPHQIYQFGCNVLNDIAGALQSFANAPNRQPFCAPPADNPSNPGHFNGLAPPGSSYHSGADTPIPKPPSSGGAPGSTNTAGSHDPNDKLGAAGFGSQAFIPAGTTIPYRIDFENDAAATAPAQEVDITDQLSTNLNWNSFELTEIGFGDQIVSVPANSQNFQTTVPFTDDNSTFNVEIDVSFDAATGKFSVVFLSIDPNTSLPPDVLTGFLPPEDGTGRGQGYVTYTVDPKSGLASGTAIRNVALISFDKQEIIATNQINPHDPSQGTDPTKEALNTIDVGGPTSSVTALAPITHANPFTLSWSGSDDANGSGIASYDIFVSDNGAAFTPLLSKTTLTSTQFTGA